MVEALRYKPEGHGLPRCTLHGKFGVPPVCCSFFGNEIEFLSLSGIESGFLKHPAHCFVTKHTMISKTVDHLLYECIKLQKEREKLISNLPNQDTWPVNKSDLVNKHIKHFEQFVNSIDFEKL